MVFRYFHYALIYEAQVVPKGGHAAKSQIMLGLRGVGKTLRLNRIEQISGTAGCRTAILEVDSNRQYLDQQ